MPGQVGKARSFLVVSLLACAAGCSSGKAGAGPIGVGYTKIDDMEGAGRLIEWTPPPGAAPGFWWSTTDCTEVDRISPVPSWADSGGWSYAALPAPYETFAGIVSSRAARLRTTSPLVGIWGATLGLTFAGLPSADGGTFSSPEMVDAGDAGASTNGQPCIQPAGESFNGVPIDLSAYSGITFWGMADPAGEKTIVVKFVDRNTDPRGGVCNAGDPSNDGSCYNGFSVGVALTATFKQYTIDFSDLTQNPSWGYHPESGVLDLQHVFDLNFEVDLPSCSSNGVSMCAGGNMPAVSFDFWIDDLYFVNK